SGGAVRDLPAQGHVPLHLPGARHHRRRVQKPAGHGLPDVRARGVRPQRRRDVYGGGAIGRRPEEAWGCWIAQHPLSAEQRKMLYLFIGKITISSLLRREGGVNDNRSY